MQSDGRISQRQAEGRRILRIPLGIPPPSSWELESWKVGGLREGFSPLKENPLNSKNPAAFSLPLWDPPVTLRSASFGLREKL